MAVSIFMESVVMEVKVKVREEEINIWCTIIIGNKFGESFSLQMMQLFM